MSPNTPSATLAMFQNALGRTEQAEDVIDQTRMAQAGAMLGLGHDGITALAAMGAVLPPLFHLFFANNTADAGDLDHDGHEHLGRFIPDVTKAGPFHRRMWAAGAITFAGMFQVGQAVQRISTLREVVRKDGRTGPLIFVTVDRMLETATGRITEERTIVYREKSTTPAPDSLPIAADDTLTPGHDWTPDYAQLFRFSALTWNAHRIHYDLSHCRADEGYPDIITHGPFTALMLANMTPQGLNVLGHGAGAIPPLKSFRFRGTQALYANRTVTLALNTDGTKAEARNHHGQQAMTAALTF